VGKAPLPRWPLGNRAGPPLKTSLRRVRWGGGWGERIPGDELLLQIPGCGGLLPGSFSLLGGWQRSASGYLIWLLFHRATRKKKRLLSSAADRRGKKTAVLLLSEPLGKKKKIGSSASTGRKNGARKKGGPWLTLSRGIEADAEKKMYGLGGGDNLRPMVKIPRKGRGKGRGRTSTWIGK